MPPALEGTDAAKGGLWDEPSKGIPAYLWIFEVVDQLLNGQVVGQHLKGLWSILGQGVVHVKSNALQQSGTSGSACSIALPIQRGMKLFRHLEGP